MGEPGGDARNREVDRTREAELFESGGNRAARAADLLAGLRRAEPVATAVRTGAPWTVESLARAIVETAATRLPGVPLDAETDLFDAGASSVHAVELVAALDRDLDVRLDLDDVFADARPRRLAEKWLGVPVAELVPAGRGPVVPTDGREDLDLIAADLALADTLPWCDPPDPVAPSRILLTGATGFLGGHLLLDLLRHSDAHVVCLVRATDDTAAVQRLGDALKGFDLPWSAEIRRRTTVLAGDLRQPRLGLSAEVWTRLTLDLDSVVSVGAAVDFLRGYPSLRQSNVLGVLTLAELAMTGRSKPLHHVSSIAVFNEIGIASMGEDDPLANVTRLVAGYDKAKWAGEVLLRRARERGLTATVLRPGGIAGHTKTGAYNAHDLSCGFASAFSRYRRVPAFRYFNVAPVDWVSRIAAAIVCEPDGWGQNYNLAGRPNTLPEMVRDLELGGMNVQVMAWEDWHEDFLARSAADPVPELDFLVRVMGSPTALKLCEANLTGPAATGERTEAFAARHDLPAPVRYGAVQSLKNYERMVRDGLITLPGRDDPPHLWFPEVMKGRLGPVSGDAESACTLRMTLSIASMYQLARKGKHHLDVRDGSLKCAEVHDRPLAVEHGEVWIRPDEGVPRRHGSDHPLLRYRLRLRDADGGVWWLEGWKTARARRDLWKQSRTLAVEIGRENEAASFTGVVKVPSKRYLRDQFDGLQVNPDLSVQEQRTAKLAWLAWFVPEMGKGLLEPGFRVVADLLDLRRDALDRQSDDDRAEDRKTIKKRVRSR
ncbi:thioester reductase domain-containing protein [Umezawaea sp. NPDC059074]|uniref:thioester reductase domain-containing protein n=1 Tax=Umezawaea sp. NPDC059074 TaxID=3346716 RepID=UPI003695B3CE